MKKQHFLKEIETERKRREEAEKERAECIRQQQLEAEHWREEQKRRQVEAEKRRVDEAEKRRLEEERQAEEERRRNEEFRDSLEERLNQQETQVRDLCGDRWIKCEFCGKIAKESEFSSYGGAVGVHLNLGTCKECSANNPAAKQDYTEEKTSVIRSYNPTVCPECGRKLIERNGRNGKFIGCSRYPACRYTRSIKRYFKERAFIYGKKY